MPGRWHGQSRSGKRQTVSAPNSAPEPGAINAADDNRHHPGGRDAYYLRCRSDAELYGAVRGAGLLHWTPGANVLSNDVLRGCVPDRRANGGTFRRAIEGVHTAPIRVTNRQTDARPDAVTHGRANPHADRRTNGGTFRRAVDSAYTAPVRVAHHEPDIRSDAATYGRANPHVDRRTNGGTFRRAVDSAYTAPVRVAHHEPDIRSDAATYGRPNLHADRRTNGGTFRRAVNGAHAAPVRVAHRKPDTRSDATTHALANPHVDRVANVVADSSDDNGPFADIAHHSNVDKDFNEQFDRGKLRI